VCFRPSVLPLHFALTTMLLLLLIPSPQSLPSVLSGSHSISSDDAGSASEYKAGLALGFVFA